MKTPAVVPAAAANKAIPAAAPQAARAVAARKPLPAPSVAAAARVRVVAVPKQKRPRRRLFKVNSEHGLVALGLIAAVSSGAFGLYMNLRNDGQPDIPGSQYLTVFAQLMRGQSAPAAPDETAGRFSKAAIDPVVTGTISPGPHAKPGTDAPPVDKSQLPLKGYVIREVFDGMALVESRYGLTLVKPDQLLLGAGRVISIERRAGKWTIVTAAGTIVETN
jgi:hypothetical protein